MWFIKHTKTGEILNLNQERISIGRLGTTYVLKNDESISRKHCTFLLKQNELKIIDDGAKYGTTIKGAENKKVSKDPMILKDGDKVHFGCYDNIWEIHCKNEIRGGIKRKPDDNDAIENSLSVSNISKKPKENPINAKISDKFDIIIHSDEELPSKSGRDLRRKYAINYSEDVVPSTSKDKPAEKKVTKIDDKESQNVKKIDQKEKSIEKSQKSAVTRSQAVFDDSDEDIFLASHEENTKKSNTGRKLIIDSDDDLFSFSHPLKPANTRKRPSNDTEDGGSSKKIPKTAINATNVSKKSVLQTSTKKSSVDEVDKSILRPPASTSQISRKRDLDDDVFNFDLIPNKHKIKNPKLANNETCSEKLTPATSTSQASIKSFSFKTSKISDKEAFASFIYDIDEDSGSWLSTRVSKIKVKDETHLDEDESINNSIDPQYNVNVNIVCKNITLDTTYESRKCFQKQKYQESKQVVTLKKLNVEEMNYCYSKKEEDSRDDWS